jgi:hypothetical protein
MGSGEKAKMVGMTVSPARVAAVESAKAVVVAFSRMSSLFLVVDVVGEEEPPPGPGGPGDLGEGVQIGPGVQHVGHPDGEHVLVALHGAGEKGGLDGQEDQENENDRDHDLVALFQAVLNAHKDHRQGHGQGDDEEEGPLHGVVDEALPEGLRVHALLHDAG